MLIDCSLLRLNELFKILLKAVNVLDQRRLPTVKVFGTSRESFICRDQLSRLGCVVKPKGNASQPQCHHQACKDKQPKRDSRNHRSKKSKDQDNCRSHDNHLYYRAGQRTAVLYELRQFRRKLGADF